jgi:hypothetical protein
VGWAVRLAAADLTGRVERIVLTTFKRETAADFQVMMVTDGDADDRW